MTTPSGTSSRAVPLVLGGVVFLSVFLLVVITATLVTFILPESFASSARVRLESAPGAQDGTNARPSESSAYDPIRMMTEVEVIRSEAVLRKVIEELDLNTTWGRKYLGGTPLKTGESRRILTGRLDVHPVRGTSLIEIRVFSDNPDEAARLANAIASTYADYASDSGALRVQILDRAEPSLRPAKPNKPLNIAMGMGVGVVLGLGCGLLTFWLTRVFQRRTAAANGLVAANER